MVTAWPAFMYLLLKVTMKICAKVTSSPPARGIATSSVDALSTFSTDNSWKESDLCRLLKHKIMVQAMASPRGTQRTTLETTAV